MEIPSVLSALIQKSLCWDWHALDWQREWLDKMCYLVEWFSLFPICLKIID